MVVVPCVSQLQKADTVIIAIPIKVIVFFILPYFTGKNPRLRRLVAFVFQQRANLFAQFRRTFVAVSQDGVLYRGIEHFCLGARNL